MGVVAYVFRAIRSKCFAPSAVSYPKEETYQEEQGVELIIIGLPSRQRHDLGA